MSHRDLQCPVGVGADAWRLVETSALGFQSVRSNKYHNLSVLTFEKVEDGFIGLDPRSSLLCRSEEQAGRHPDPVVRIELGEKKIHLIKLGWGDLRSLCGSRFPRSPVPR